MVFGDSHARRMQPYTDQLQRLTGVTTRWCYRGGATCAFVRNNLNRASQNHVVVIMTGGNDLQRGISPQAVADELQQLARDCLQLPGVERVIITESWPRTDQLYNQAALQLASILDARFYGHPAITFWVWDLRQPWRNVDGVHLTTNGYRRAVRYLYSALAWATHPRRCL